MCKTEYVKQKEQQEVSKMKHWTLMILLILCLAVIGGQPRTVHAAAAGIVSVDQVNLRTAPNLESAVIGVLVKKDVVQYLYNRNPCQVNGYVRVLVVRAVDKSLEGMEGWVVEKYLYCPQAD